MSLHRLSVIPTLAKALEQTTLEWQHVRFHPASPTFFWHWSFLLMQKEMLDLIRKMVDDDGEVTGLNGRGYEELLNNCSQLNILLLLGTLGYWLKCSPDCEQINEFLGMELRILGPTLIGITIHSVAILWGRPLKWTSDITSNFRGHLNII